MIVRPALPDDIPALRDLFLRSRRAAFVWEVPSSLSLGDFDSRTEGEWQMVALDGERPMGFLSLWARDDFIHYLHVDPDHVRCGVGRALLEALPGWPTTRYRLKCVALNSPALAFYRAMGFAPIGEGRAGDHDYLLLEHRGAIDR